MKFTIMIDCNNFANPSQQVGEVLRIAVNRIEGHPHFSAGHSQPLHDREGNEVGYFDCWEDEAEPRIIADFKNV